MFFRAIKSIREKTKGDFKMRKGLVALSLVLVFIMTFGVVGASAKENVLSNDKFYAEIPDGFEINTNSGENHYYLYNNYSYDELDIIVEGNLRFPDGIKNTPENVIEKRFKNFVFDNEDTGDIDIKKLEKGDINGISACYVYAVIDSEIYQNDIFAYIITTEENLFVVYTTVTSGIQEGAQPDFLKEFMRGFLVNGTYYDGEELSKEHDFSKAEPYIDALERDMLTDDYYEYNDGLNGVIMAFVILTIAMPIVFIVLIILYVKTRKKLKEYKELFGPIEKARAAMYQQRGQGAYGAYGYNNQQAYGNGQPYSYAPNMQNYNTGTGAYGQPQYAQPQQPYYPPVQPAQQYYNQPAQPVQPVQPAQPVQQTQPAQPTLAPELQDSQSNNVNQ